MGDTFGSSTRGVLTMLTEELGGTHVIQLIGELDGASARDVEDELFRIERIDGARTVLDLRSLDFIDSTGLAVIFRASCRAEENRYAFAIKIAPGPVKRVLDVCELTEVLPIVVEEVPRAASEARPNAEVR